MRLLSSSSEKLQGHAQHIIIRLASTPTFPQQFVAAGACDHLVDMLHSKSASEQQRAVALFRILAANGLSVSFATVECTGAVPPSAQVLKAASPEAMRYDAEKLVQALTTGTLLSSAIPVHPASAAGLPSTAAAALPPAAASSQRQQLPPRPRRSCWWCGVTGVPLKKCSVCAVAAYCGAGCQKADWKAHKGQCAGLKAGARGSGSSAAGKK